MNPDEYDEAYREALLSIANASIGEPYFNKGQRFCRINQVPHHDFEVFELAWGRKIADRIQRERNATACLRLPARRYH